MRKHFGSNPWFFPLPVLIIGTYDENGKADAMNAAWGGLYDRDKVVLCLSAGHKTTKNIKARGAFTVSFADAAKLQAISFDPCGNTYVKMGEVVGKAFQDGGKLK